MSKRSIQTSLGIPLLEQEPALWRLDLSELKLFTGLSVVARLIGDEVQNQLQNGNADIFVYRRLIGDITPDLIALGIDSVSLFSRRTVLANLDNYFESFQNQLRTVFGTFQRPGWAQVMFPEHFQSDTPVKNLPNQPSGPATTHERHPALLFPFYSDQVDRHLANPEVDFYFLVERLGAEKLLRITIESKRDQRLDLKKLQPITVRDLNRRSYIQGLSRIAHGIYQGVLRECENQSTEYFDTDRRNQHFFQQLQQVRLADCETLVLRWPANFAHTILEQSSEWVIDLFKRIIIVLEDHQVVELLLGGSTILIKYQNEKAWLDLSRRGRSLNISLQEPRAESSLDYYLNRMPGLARVARQSAGLFENTRIFLIHHITGEILATIKAIEETRPAFLDVFFVKYAGQIPADYLEALLTQNAEQYFFAGLQKVDDRDNLAGYHIFSGLYSDAGHLGALQRYLIKARLPYFEAMQLTAGHLFLHSALQAWQSGQRVVIIEDGGYLAPILNDLCLQKATLAEALEHFQITGPVLADWGLAQSRIPIKKSLAAFLKNILLYTVEHTRNGFNQLETVEQRHGRLQFCAGSIAISDIKRNRESEEVSISILHAMESILHGQGKVFSERKALVLGSRGAIGSNVMLDLGAKLTPAKVLGIDLAVTTAMRLPNLEVQSWSALKPAERAGVDVIIGVTGSSVLKARQLDELFGQSTQSHLWFASGSTKTAEFTDLMHYFQKLHTSRAPRIAKEDVQLEQSLLRDPQTRHIVGNQIRLFFPNRSTAPSARLPAVIHVYLLGGLTPINFLFYGVPTETMDGILAQLLQVSAGLIRRQQQGQSLPPRLLAVDRDIDPDANPIQT
ncbi:MAG: hypothetical protein KDK39_19150 [Leptospiraceae bacterium]|nr:hypothetical protein [Leptospiraceae bacterium]